MVARLPIYVAAFLLLAAGGVRLAHGAPEPIRHFAGIRSLSRDFAAMALPVEIQGVVVWSIPGALVVHDGECGIFVSFWESRAAGVWRNDIPDPGARPTGTVVKITGVTNPGGFAPVVLPSAIEYLGSVLMPPARRLPVERLLSGAEDGQYVELEGVVQELSSFSAPNGQQFFGLKMVTDGHPCLMVPAYSADPGSMKYLDARVRVRGVLAPTANLRAQNTGIKIGVMSEADVEVLRPPPADPFRASRVGLDKLLGFAPDSELFHRKVTTGVVAFAVPGQFFYLQNDKASVRVESPETGLRPGDNVDVAGFIDTSRVLAALKGGEVRVMGRATAPPPVPVTVGKILRPELRGEWEAVAESDYDGRVVQLDGILRRVVPAAGPLGSATLLIEADETLFETVVPVMDDAAREFVAGWMEGSAVAVSGLCEMDIRKANRPGWFAIEGFTLLLADPGGLRVLRVPPWWTPRRLAIALAGLGTVLALAMAWVVALRRQVARCSARLAAEISAREAAAHEFDATLRERQRLAGDLHNSLEQALTGLALQLEAAELFRGSDPERGANHLRLARKFLDRSREDVHRTVWDLRANGLGGIDLAAALRERATAMAAGLPVGITVEADGPPADLPDVLAGNLLLAAQEAITNALKHARASSIRVRVVNSPGQVAITISDDGCGFDPADVPGQKDGHFGLQGMRERVKRLGGRLDVQSTPGHGTKIDIAVDVDGPDI